MLCPVRLPRFLVLALLCGAAAAAPAAPPTDDTPAFSKAEILQGYRHGRVLALPREGLAATCDAAEQADPRLRLARHFARLGGLRVLASAAGEDTPALAARLRASGRYAFVEPDYLRAASALPNDPLFTNGSQWSLRNDGRSSGTVGADIGAALGWDARTSAASVIVAVIDSGVRLTHDDLAANLWSNPGEIPGNGVDDDNNGYIDDVHGIDATRASSGDPSDVLGHGTLVAGVIGAVGDNARGITGVAWQVQLMPLRFLGADGFGAISDAIECIDYAIARGAHIINASYGAISGGSFSAGEREAIRRARAAGLIFVAAAGNDGRDLGTASQAPATLLVDNLVAVGASGRRDEAEVFSNFGSGMVELFAPGTSILSTGHTADNFYTNASGTSFAAPHVSGALALLKARLPAEPYRGLINRLLRTATPTTGLRAKTQTGRLNLPLLLAANDPRPVNDDFADATTLSGANVRARAGNTFATTQPGEPTFPGFTGGASLWWRWTAPADALVTVDTTESVTQTGTTLTTRPGIFTGTTLDQLATVALSTTSSPGRLTFNALAGTTYTLLAASADASPGLVVLSLGTAPANNSFALATPLAGPSPSATDSNLNSNLEPGEPPTSFGGRSVWYRWTAPATGRIQASVVSDEFDPALSLYTGDSLASLTLVAANDNAAPGPDITSALLTFDAIAGTTYHLAVDSADLTAGTFTLTLIDSLWQFVTGDSVTSSPAVAPDGSLYFGSIDHNLYALAPDGTEKWRFNTGGLIDMGSPSLAPDGTIYVGSNDRFVRAFAPDGTVRWTHEAADAVNTSIAQSAAGDLYFKDSTGLLTSLTAAGALRWTRSVGGETFASPTLAPDGTIYVGAAELGLHAFTPEGTLRWRFPADGDIFTAAALDADGNLYFATLNGSLYSLTPAGILRWRRTLASGISSSPVLAADGTAVYLGTYDQQIHAVNTTDGTVRWTFDLPDQVRATSPLVAADGSLLLGCFDGRLYHLEPDGRLRRTYATGRRIRSSPVLAGQRLYVGSNDGKLYALDLGLTASATSPWPMFQHNPARLGHRLATAPAAPTLATSIPPTAPGGTLTLDATTTGVDLALQWSRDGLPLPGATTARLTLANLQPADAGLYTLAATDSAGTATSRAALVAPTLPAGTRTAGTVILAPGGADIRHPNGNLYDQFLLTGPAATLTSTPGKVTRVSYVDLNDDIVQVELSGPGSLTLVLENPTGPAAPLNYQQSGVAYLRGHARLHLTAATAETHLTIFTVGKLTAFDPTGAWDLAQPASTTNDPLANGNPIFRPDAAYDGIADLAAIALASPTGAFGGLRGGNVALFASAGLTGLYAPGLTFNGPVVLHDVTAFNQATPVLDTGPIAGGDLLIAGGNLEQPNGRAIQIGALGRLVMRAGTDAHARLLPAQANRARLERAGVDVTAATIANPGP